MNITKLIPQPRYHGRYASKKQRLHNLIGFTSTALFSIFYITNVISGMTQPQPVEAMISPVPTSPVGVTFSSTFHQQQVNSSGPTGAVTATPSPAPTGSTEHEEIVELIIDVFGEHADKAFLLLQGDGAGTCAENRHLDPDAMNDNTQWGGVGKDWGIFQINDHWQGFRHAGKAEQFLTDPELNIRIAWRIFEDNGYSFSRWTCGRVYGI